MRGLIEGSQFRKDVKRAQRRGWKMDKLRETILILMQGEALPAKFKDHPLKGNWKHHRDCHIEPDWVLIYKIDGNDLFLVRTGTHADLFE